MYNGKKYQIKQAFHILHYKIKKLKAKEIGLRAILRVNLSKEKKTSLSFVFLFFFVFFDRPIDHWWNWKQDYSIVWKTLSTFEVISWLLIGSIMENFAESTQGHLVMCIYYIPLTLQYGKRQKRLLYLKSRPDLEYDLTSSFLENRT